MSTTANTSQPTTGEQRLTDQQARLVIEAAKYQGLSQGARIALREVEAQAKANGYVTYEEGREKLDHEGRKLLGDLSSPIEVPPQGDLLGDLWRDDPSPTLDSATEYPHPKATLIDGFDQWLEGKREDAHPFPLEHNWSKRAVRKRFGRAKDVDRCFQREYDSYSTVMVTRHADGNTDPLLEQTQALSPAAYTQERRRLLERLGVKDEYAAVVVLAPKYDLPQSNPTEVRTHIHECYWIPDRVPAEDFHPLIEKHVAKVDGASADRHTTDDNRITAASVTVQQHSTETYPTFSQQSKIDERRGATSGLPYEILANQPLKDSQTDASDLHDDRAMAWCATMSIGTDSSQEPHKSRGISTWTPLGRFREYADEMDSERQYWRMTELQYHREMRSLNAPILSQQSDDYHDDLPESLPTLEEPTVPQSSPLHD